MSFGLVRAVAALERSDDLHLARILVLLRAAAKKSNKPVDGITKLVKLDFLLRYPNCLERALTKSGADPAEARIGAAERTTIETGMIRFRYGPWDARYRKWLALLQSRGLLTTALEGRTVRVQLTDAGHATAEKLAETPAFAPIAVRSRLLIKAVGSLSASALRDFVYETFPEITTMGFGEDIQL